MCGLGGGGNSSAAAPLIASTSSREAVDQGEIQARMRRARAGAAAQILTSPTGIPSTPQMGKVAT